MIHFPEAFAKIPPSHRTVKQFNWTAPKQYVCTSQSSNNLASGKFVFSHSLGLAVN